MNLKPRARDAALLLTCLLASAACARAAPAAETVKVRDASKKYDLEVSVEGCGGARRSNDANQCSGRASVRLFRRGSRTPFQVLRLPNVELYKDTAAYSPETSAKPRGLYAEEYTFVFDDFNFDGREDLAICNGRHGGYGGPSYTVFLFDARAGRFVESRPLSRLADGPYLGLFFPDPKSRTLTTFSKDGCCYHEIRTFEVAGDRPVLVEYVIEDATPEGGAPDGYEIVTRKKRAGRRWVVTRKKVKLDDNQN